MQSVRTNSVQRLAAAVSVGVLTLVLGAAALAATPAKTAERLVSISHGARVSYWAYPQAAALVRSSPSVHARGLGRLRFLTPDGLGQAQIYTVLGERRSGDGTVWAKVSLPRRPNGVTGWVRASALGPLNVVYGLLVVNRKLLRATLYNRYGHAIWSARVGMGRVALPTPSGHFYVLEKLRALGGGTYGPFALGTSAYAPKLSDWPGGGVVGIHGTDEPWLIPGYPSHGCVRLTNPTITSLWHLIKLGTKVDIT